MKKDDSNEPVTKGEFRELVSRFDHSMKAINVRFNHIESTMVTRDEWHKWLNERWDKHMTMMDALMNEMEKSRQSRILFERQCLRTDDTLQDHEKRIQVLEKG